MKPNQNRWYGTRFGEWYGTRFGAAVSAGCAGRNRRSEPGSVPLVGLFAASVLAGCAATPAAPLPPAEGEPGSAPDAVAAPAAAESATSPRPAEAGLTREPAHLPTPYTADQLRRSLRVGSHTLSRIEREGAPTRIQRTTVVAADDHGCRLEAETWDEGDFSSIQGAAFEASWSELRDHARFPAASAERSREVREFCGREWDCWRYTVRRADGGERSMWFPLESPGSPALFEQTADGRTVYREVLLATDRGELP